MRQKKLIIVIILIIAMTAVGIAIMPRTDNTQTASPETLLQERKPHLMPITYEPKGEMVSEQLVKAPFYSYLTHFYLIDDVDGDQVAVAIFDVPNHVKNSRVWAAIVADAETVSSQVSHLLPGVGLYVVAGLQVTDDCDDSGCGHHDFIEVFVAYVDAETMRRGVPFPGARLMQGDVFWDEYFFSNLKESR